ncbi:MAG: hypothetical protein SGI73_22810 [Chloroflexota bacterium]|nr:hypothetical protein [Chloroflexota bacterium]
MMYKDCEPIAAAMLKRLFNKTNGDAKSNPPSPPPAWGFTITYASGRTLRAVRAQPDAPPEPVIDALGLSVPRPVMFLMSGAGKMDSEASQVTRASIEDGLARFAEARLVNVLDGGTTTGGMALIGLARFRRGYRFPLIGVAPESVVAYPGYDNPARQADIDAFHSHIVLTAGAQFGAESDLLLGLARAISGYGAQPALGVVVNGGAIVKHEVYRCATGATLDGARLSLLVLEGSGRFADELAAAHKAREAGRNGTALLQDPVNRAILEQGDVHFLSVSGGSESLRAWLENFYKGT